MERLHFFIIVLLVAESVLGNRNTIRPLEVKSGETASKISGGSPDERAGADSGNIDDSEKYSFNLNNDPDEDGYEPPLRPRHNPNFVRKPCAACEIEAYILRNATKAYPPQVQMPDGSLGVVKVEARLIVNQLLDMNVRDESLQVMCTVRIMWTDNFMTWEPQHYGGIVEIRTRPHKLWVPDLLLENSYGQSQVHQLDYQNYVVVSYFGLLYWAIPMVVHSKCRTDVTYFPFDQQRCSIKISSWTYHDKLINFTLSQYDSGMEQPISNIEWTITEVKGTFHPNPMSAPHPYYPGEVISYPFITYDISMKRKPSFYVNLLVVPSFVISWLGAVIYLIPNASGEKLGFSITLFLSLYVNQVIVAEHLPPSADTFPLIARFYMLISFMLAISVFPTVFTLSFHYKLILTLEPEQSFCSPLLNWFEKLGRCKSFWFLTCCCEATCKCISAGECNGISVKQCGRRGRRKEKQAKDQRLAMDNEALQSFTLVNNHYKDSCKYVLPPSANNNHNNNNNNKLYLAMNNGVRRHLALDNNGAPQEFENNHVAAEFDAVVEDERRIGFGFGRSSELSGMRAEDNAEERRRDSMLAHSTELMLERVLNKIENVLSSEPDRLLQRWQVIAAGVDKLGFFLYCLSLTLVTGLFTFFLVLRNYPSS